MKYFIKRKSWKLIQIENKIITFRMSEISLKLIINKFETFSMIRFQHFR